MAHYWNQWDAWDLWEEDNEMEEAQGVVGRRCRKIVKGNHLNAFYIMPCHMGYSVFYNELLLKAQILYVSYWFKSAIINNLWCLPSCQQ